MDIGPLMGLLAAIVLFLYGIEHLSRELQKIASDRMRGALQKLTKNRWMGGLVGAATTAAIQSSTATTVIAVGLVNAGIISFAQSVGVIAGANVGTTVTAQLIAFKFAALAPIFLVLGFLISVSGSRFRFIGKTIFYFGFLFLAINFLSDSIAPFKQNEEVLGLISGLDNVFLGIAAGALLTILLQSSSATTGIVVVLGTEGVLGLGAAIPIIMGANIGTSSTAILSAWKMELFAKRTAAAHALFNICGVLVFLPILGAFTGLIYDIGGDTGHMIANAHTLFNTTTAVVFLLFLKPVIAISEKIVPGKEKELIFKTKYLEEIPANTNSAIRAVEKELKRQMELVRDSFYLSYGMVRAAKADRMAKVNKLETLNDYLEERISLVLVTLSERELNPEQSEDIVILARLSNKVEQLGDLGKEFAKLAVKLDDRGEHLIPEAVYELDEIKKGFDEILGKLIEKGWNMDKRTYRSITQKRAKTEKNIHASYRKHIKRLADKELSSYTSTIFIDAAYSIERANSALLRMARLMIKLRNGN
jgi:phosphate:Na+ symporter